jgi:uncharacterized membrane protein required for colicin V production
MLVLAPLMNGLDVVIIAVVALAALYGLGRGALRMLTSVVSLAAGIYLASLYYPLVARLAVRELPNEPQLSAVIGYVVVFLAAFVAVEAAGQIVDRLIRTIHLSWINSVAGGAMGGAIGLLVSGLALMLLTAVLPADTPLLRNSQLAPSTLAFAQSLIGFIPPELKQAYETKRVALERYWIEHTLTAGSSPTATPAR